MRRSLSRLRRLAIEHLDERRVLATITVDLTTDVFNGNFAPGDISLREAVFFTNRDSGPNTIAFAANLSGKTISLRNEIVIEEDVSILGLGQDKLTIDAAGSSRLFSIREGFRNVPNVELIGLKLSGANTVDSGAAIRSVGANLIVRDSWITNNSTTNHGGAIWVAGGTLNPTVQTAVTIVDTTISANSAHQGGGAIYVTGGSLNLVNSTLSGNSVRDQGGGLFVSGGTASVTNSTIAFNRADSNGVNNQGSDLGGGITRTGGSITLRNSIVIGNLRGTGNVSNDIEGRLEPTSARNIVGNASSAGGLRNGVNANIVGTNGVGQLAPSSVLETGLTISAGTARTHNLVATSPAIDSGANALATDPNGLPLAKDQRGISRVIDADQNGTSIVDRGAVEYGHSPFLNLAGSISYVEQAAAVILAPSATVTDRDSSDFGGGNLRVSIARVNSTDSLSIRNQGSSVAQISVSGNQIRFGGILIGTFSGGSTSALIVRLNSSATIAATRALVRNIAYRSTSDSPPTLGRNVMFVLTDKTGLTSDTKSIRITTVAKNDAPRIGNLISDSVTHNLVGNNPTKILKLGTVVDPDSPNFLGGTLTVRISQGIGSDNRLAFASPFSRIGNTLRYNGTDIGSVNANGGVGTTLLVVSFKAAATRVIVEELIRSLTFQISNPTGDDEPNRVIRVSLTDGDGGTSNIRTITVDPKFVRG